MSLPNTTHYVTAYTNRAYPLPPQPSIASSSIPYRLRRMHTTPNLNAQADVNATLTPKQMHNHIFFQRRWKKYYSLTTTTLPWTPWHPLLAHPQMETRPCHHSSSRIHALTCGHIIAVPRNAEPCAANCAPNITLSSLCFKLPIPAPHVGVLEKIRKSIVEGVNAYGAAFAGNDRALEAKVAVHVEILRGVWERQERRILPVPDLMGGDFSCVKCGNEGHRVAFPAHTLADDPYWCIVVGREARDRAIIAELEKGAFQEPLDYQYRYRFQARQQHQQQDGKRGASESLIRAAQLGRYVRNARVTKARVEEKKRVVEQLWDEALLEEVGALDFGI